MSSAAIASLRRGGVVVLGVGERREDDGVEVRVGKDGGIIRCVRDQVWK